MIIHNIKGHLDNCLKKWGERAVLTFFLAGAIALGWTASGAQEDSQPTVTPSQQPTGEPAGAVPTIAPGGRAHKGGAYDLQPDPDHPTLPIDSPAPDFKLMGIDGKAHTLADYSNAKVLAIVFESNHCPVSIAYEDRMRGIYEDYKSKGVQLIAINPNNPKAVRLEELAWTDASDSLEEMKVRAALRHIDWPFLYDGETQAISAKFGAIATPHIFIFDQDRKLRYEGRIDNSPVAAKVTKSDARDAIEALLAGQPIPVPSTRAFGCSTKWLSKATGVEEEMANIQKEPVDLTAVSSDDLRQIRNATGKSTVLVFWSYKCAECKAELLGYENSFRMYRHRKFDMYTINTDKGTDRDAALQYLKSQYASTKNLQYKGNAKLLQQAVGATWKVGEPFVMVLGPDATIVYQKAGKADILEVRRHVLASIPNDGPWVGVKEYWAAVINAEKH